MPFYAFYGETQQNGAAAQGSTSIKKEPTVLHKGETTQTVQILDTIGKGVSSILQAIFGHYSGPNVNTQYYPPGQQDGSTISDKVMLYMISGFILLVIVFKIIGRKKH